MCRMLNECKQIASFSLCHSKEHDPSPIRTMSEIYLARLAELKTPVHHRMLTQSNAVEVESMVEMLNWMNESVEIGQLQVLAY